MRQLYEYFCSVDDKLRLKAFSLPRFGSHDPRFFLTYDLFRTTTSTFLFLISVYTYDTMRVVCFYARPRGWARSHLACVHTSTSHS